jgi:flagellar motility protein MotE (MotC chaperone)
MNPYVVDVVDRARHGVELPRDEVKKLVVGGTDILEAFEEQIYFLQSELSERDRHINELEAELAVLRASIREREVA